VADLFVTGVAETGVGKSPDTGIDDLFANAARLAVADAGLEPAAVDGIITVVPRADPLVWHADSVADALGLKPRFVTSVSQGGSAILMTLYQAWAAIDAGLASRILVVGADLLYSGGTSNAVASMADTALRTFERCYGLTVPSAFALLAQRHMHEFGTTSEELAQVPVSMRRNAASHPQAQAQGELTVEDVLVSRMIASPLHLFDCSLVSDGAAALVVERATDAERGVRVLAWAEAHNPEWVTQALRFDETSCGAVATASALKTAGVARDDIDVALIYDPFSISVIVALEDMGYCDRGEGGAFVSSGVIEPDGALPVNPHGGLLSHAHPGRPAALLHIVEAVRQLRGEALGVQIPDAELALVTAEGAMLGAYATVILGR
jgi:acetyl-CoA acetyltransferase